MGQAFNLQIVTGWGLSVFLNIYFKLICIGDKFLFPTLVNRRMENLKRSSKVYSTLF